MGVRERGQGEGVNPANPLQPVTHPSLSQQSGLPLADPPFPLLPLANIFGYYRLPIFCADAFEMKRSFSTSAPSPLPVWR